MTDRDTPYNADEQRVADYLLEIAPAIGAGNDPIGVLIASHRAIGAALRSLRAEPRPNRAHDDLGRVA